MSNQAVFHDPQNQRIDFCDQRFYKKQGEDIYYPSVNTILDAIDKGKEFHTWQKSLGFNADIVLRDAGEFGTKIHEAIDSYVNGELVTWMNENGKQNFTLEEWKCFLKFVDFWQTWKPIVIASEVKIVSDIYKVGGTIDLVCEINGEIWLLDFKTSNYLHDTYDLQIAAYAMMWNSIFPKYPIKRTGIIHLKAAVKGPDKTKKGHIQGRGWKLYESEKHYGDNFKVFRHVQQMWEWKNPTYKPANYYYSDRAQLNASAVTDGTITGQWEKPVEEIAA
jgi:hypothetical protein